MSREVDVTVARLDQIIIAAKALRAVLADLYSLGYDQTGAQLSGVRGGTTPGVENIGDPVAREVFRRAFFEVRNADARLGGIRTTALNYLGRGGPVPEPSRGSLISRSEFDAQLDRQAARRRSGDYTPARHIPQPPYPGGNT